MGQGDETLRATATDTAGNTAQATRDISVDTFVPVFRSDNTGEVAIRTNIEVIVYDANAIATEGGTNDEGITYTLGGTDASPVQH